MDKVLLINDYVNYEQIALKAMETILTYNNYQCLAVPSCLVTNTFDYGKFNILDTTDYLKNSLEVYQQLGFNYGCLCSGYLNNFEQVKIVGMIKENNPNMILMVDPIMADNGKLYNGKNSEHIKQYQHLITKADIIIPNYTESCLLADMPIKDRCTIEELKAICNKLKETVKGHIIISSCHLVNDIHCIFGYDVDKKKTFTVSYDYINASFAGSGDVFSSFLISSYLRHKDIKKAAIEATSKTSKLLKLNLINKSELINVKHKSLNINQFLNQL